jgi:hypothetical protein
MGGSPAEFHYKDEPMKIAHSPYHASIIPHKGKDDFLWFCVIRREGSADIVARHDASNKEDACCVALLELSRLHGVGAGVGAGVSNRETSRY